MEKGGPSPISPRHCRARRRSSRCGPPRLTRSSDAGGVALSPSSGPRVPHLTPPLRGDGPSLAPAGYCSAIAGPQGRAPPRDARPN
ncbi:hypothetical protein NDU88_006044 [Pleurodeles waltl]|uniref:Uncharacterized protein n=1 Tax=Pleurodeles waltl TaxID=8319 RepID=A0AAV7MY22_PLEWA|nr:hypothetical protein NDU88_006044 [Pleurodeles waltl]